MKDITKEGAKTAAPEWTDSDTDVAAEAKKVDLRDSGLWYRQEPARSSFYWQDGGLLAVAVSAGGE